jgi:formylglycine-generating enzyme required for sulfatase activity
MSVDGGRRDFCLRLGTTAMALVGSACVGSSVSTQVDAADARRNVELPGGVPLSLVRIEAGEFVMGSPDTEEGRSADETLHKVVLTQPFWLGRTEVTQAQWTAMMHTTIAQQRDLAQEERRNRPGLVQQLWGEGSEHPVYYVSWEEATEFCRRLNERETAARRIPEGYAYALPTEAQWEYACRAGSSGPFGAGGDADDLVWYEKTADGLTHPVATKRANAWGVYDMHGNVWEWCSDYYAEYPSGSVVDPLGPSSGLNRVERGGRWANPARLCRAAQRNGEPGVSGGLEAKRGRFYFALAVEGRSLSRGSSE